MCRITGMARAGFTMFSKIRAFMKNLSSLLFLTVLALSWGTAQAERADRDKPMNIEADALRHDDQKQISTFTGKVTLTKGTIVMRGSRLEVRQDAQGNQFGVLTAEPGKLGFFRQKRDGVDEYIEGEAERIEYDSQADHVRLLRKAELRRYRGAKLNDEISGNLIVYDNKTDMFSVDGVPGPAGAGRVRAVLAPRAAASGAGVPEAGRTGAAQTAPALRSSATLGGDRK
jgi:lipopolysaccharide export system protein LptA